MTNCNIHIHRSSNRLRLWRNLLFFVTTLAACNSEQGQLSIEWKDGKAVAVQIPAWVTKGIVKDSMARQISIVNDNDSGVTPILGSFERQNGLRFEPLVPFSPGIPYSVMVNGRSAAHFSIPFEKGDAPKILRVFPAIDTVPENLLKIYLVFSHPLREGVSHAFVQWIRNEKDTLRDVFLDLQPELWNQERTTLTLWLDPGRIKRDLQPNRKLGAPLHASEKYRLVIAKGWPDAQGKTMQEDHSAVFTTTQRNDRSPDPSKWKIMVPVANSNTALAIAFDKPLDHFLLVESLHIKDALGNRVKGTFTAGDKDRACNFTPAQQWKKGAYELVIDSKLEDLAGNNVNRPFDRDVTNTKTPSSQPFYTLRFTINP